MLQDIPLFQNLLSPWPYGLFLITLPLLYLFLFLSLPANFSPFSPDSSKYIILIPDSTPSSPTMSEISSPNASPSPIPFPLISRQFFPSPNSPNSFHYIILSPDSTPPSPSSPRSTKTPPPPLSPIREVLEDDEPPDVDVLIRMYEALPNCPEHILIN